MNSQHNHGHKHEHGLRSSKDFLDAPSLLEKIGLGPGATFLDIGCGDGHFSVAAASLVGSETMVHAIDIEPYGIEMLLRGMEEKGIGNIRAHVMDATLGLPVTQSGFQVIQKFSEYGYSLDQRFDAGPAHYLLTFIHK